MFGLVVEVVCLQNDTIKVIVLYLNFWLSFKASQIKWLTCQRESRESTVVIIMVALPKAGVGQEAGVGQGLPNFSDGAPCTALWLFYG